LEKERGLIAGAKGRDLTLRELSIGPPMRGATDRGKFENGRFGPKQHRRKNTKSRVPAENRRRWKARRGLGYGTASKDRETDRCRTKKGGPSQKREEKKPVI